MFTVREIKKEDTYEIRHKILRTNKAFETVKFDTDEYDGTFHIGVFDKRKIVCVVSFSLEQFLEFGSTKEYRLRGMATIDEYKKMGAGSLAVCFAEKILIENGYDFIWCKARTNAIEFYKKLGFKQRGDIFNNMDLGSHVIMYKNLII